MSRVTLIALALLAATAAHAAAPAPQIPKRFLHRPEGYFAVTDFQAGDTQKICAAHVGDPEMVQDPLTPVCVLWRSAQLCIAYIRSGGDAGLTYDMQMRSWALCNGWDGRGE